MICCIDNNLSHLIAMLSIRTQDMEVRLLNYIKKIRVALSVQNPRKEDARGYLDAMLNLVVSGLMLKKNPHVVDTIKKVLYTLRILLITTGEARVQFGQSKYILLTFYRAKISSYDN